MAADGTELLAAAAPIDYLGARWAVVAERSVAESLAAVDAMRDFDDCGHAGHCSAGGAGGILFSRSVIRQIARLTRTMQALAKGDLGVAVEGADKSNEIGDMAKAVEVFRENGLKMAQMTEADAARIIRDQEGRAWMMAELQKILRRRGRRGGGRRFLQARGGQVR